MIPLPNDHGSAEIGPLADYIAMLALSQGRYYGTSQDVSTITNLMAADCGAEMKPAAITDVDMTYLRGLYNMNTGGSYMGERASIEFEMKKGLGGYWGQGAVRHRRAHWSSGPLRTTRAAPPSLRSKRGNLF